MKTFKEQILADITETFFDLEEFGEKHMLDNKEVNLIIDDNELIERMNKTSDEYDGIFKKQVLIYVRAEDYGTLPRIDKPINLDGRDFLVKKAINEDGIYSIHMEANKS